MHIQYPAASAVSIQGSSASAVVVITYFARNIAIVATEGLFLSQPSAGNIAIPREGIPNAKYNFNKCR